MPAPGSPGQCLRLQVSICCKEDSEWVGAGEQPFWLVWGPREWRGGSGKSLGALDSGGPLLPPLASGSLRCTVGMASPGARPSKAFTELVASNGTWEEPCKSGLRGGRLWEGLASSRDPEQRGGSDQLTGRARRRLRKQEDPSVLPLPSQSLSQPILSGAMERVARQGGKEGPLPVPSVSCCCCCSQFCDS